MEGDRLRNTWRTGLCPTVFVLLCLLWVPGLSAEAEKTDDRGAVKGVLVDRGWETQAWGVVVMMRDLSTGMEYVSAPADEGGRFEIAGLPEGRYRVEIAAGGKRIKLGQSIFVKGREAAQLRLDIGPGELSPEWDVARGVYGMMEVMCKTRPPASPWKPPGKPPWVPGPPPWHPGQAPWPPGPPPWHAWR